MNVQEMMKQAKKIQAEMEKKQKELGKQEFLVEKQGVKLTVYGNRTIKSLKIDDFLIDPDDKELLEDLMVVAFNEAIALIDTKEQEIEDSFQSPGMPI